MGSRDETTSHQPYLSSLVVRPSDSDGGYEPGELRPDSPPYSRSLSPSDQNHGGYRARSVSVSVSPVRRREIDRKYSTELDNLDSPPRHRPFVGEREAPRSPGRFRDFSGRFPRGRGGRTFGRGFGGRGYDQGAARGRGMHRNPSNVRPREGDWLCSHPMCGNLNFARRDHCNKCKRHRYGDPPPPMGPPRRFPGPPMDRFPPGRFMNGYRSPPPRGWARGGPRDFGPGGPPPPRHEGRFADHPFHRERLDYPEEDFREREWGPREHARDSFMDKKGYERRSLSPLPVSPPPAARGRWADRDIRERSRSPLRGGPPSKEFRRDPYIERGRDERRGGGRGRIDY